MKRCIVLLGLLLGGCAKAGAPAPAEPAPAEVAPAPAVDPPAAPAAGEMNVDLLAADAPGPPPSPSTPPVNIAAAMMEGQRLAGTPRIPLPDAVIARLRAANVTRVQAKIKVCVDQGGLPSDITFEQSLGDEGGDAALRASISEWRYRPYVVAGQARAVCFIAIFNYDLRN